MARNRQLYAGDLLFVGPTGIHKATGSHFTAALYNESITAQSNSGANLCAELFRVQSANFNSAKTLTDVNQFGELARIDAIPLEQPTVSLSAQWLTANLVNEKLIGLTVSSGALVSAFSGVLTTETDSKNYFIVTVPEGNDVVGYNTPSNNYVTAIGNGFLSNYTAEGSVGAFPTASITVEGLNIEMHSNSSGNRIPAVNPTDGSSIPGWLYALPVGTQNPRGQTINTSTSSLSVLRPGNITLSLGLGEGQGFVSESDMKIQSYSVSLDVGREDLQKLGSKYAFAKVIRFPANATMTVTADVGDFQTGSLIEIVNNNDTFNPSVTLKNPDNTNVIAWYQLRGAKFDNQDFSSSIGPSKSVTMTFTTQISSAQSSNGIFMSGVV